MFRSKDFILMDVVDIKGKKIGCIKDLVIDFNNKNVRGFIISSYKLFKKEICVFNEDIVSFSSNMIITGFENQHCLKLSSMKNMDVINKNGEIIGIVEDILFSREKLLIKGIVVSTGFVRNFLFGKRIILLDKLILGEENVYCYDDNKKINLLSVPHKLIHEDKCNEENI